MHNLAKRFGKIGAATAISGLAVLVMSSSAFAVATDHAGGSITDPTHATTLTSVTSTTSFSVGLPAQSACAQDGTHGTVVYSFLVPELGSTALDDAEISGMTFTGGFSSVGYFLASSTGTPMPGLIPAVGTAVIPAAPTFTAGGLVTAGIPLNGVGGLIDTTAAFPGQWVGGLVCTLGPAPQDFWPIHITFNANGGFTVPSAVTPEAGLAVGLPVAGVAVLGGVVVYRRRKAHVQASAVAAA